MIGPLKKHNLLTPAEHAKMTAEKNSKAKGNKQRRKEEEREQKKFVAWLKQRGLVFWHTPNQLSARSARHGAHYKAMGVRAGVPDIIIANPVTGARCVAIEMKSRTGLLSNAQAELMPALERCGWVVHVARNFEAARDFVIAIGL